MLRVITLRMITLRVITLRLRRDYAAITPRLRRIEYPQITQITQIFFYQE
jgi:hypothetical protein